MLDWIPTFFSAAVSWTRLVLCAVLASCLFVAGCSQMKDLDQSGANQSLVEIGERSLEMGESMEDEGRTSEANLSYKRALWAFRYHQQLTGEEPLLLDDALDAVERTTKRRD